MKKLILVISIILSILVSCSPQGSRRDQSMKPELIMDVIGVKAGMVIGEVGAGEGYFTFHLSKRVGPTGKIYANDINLGVLRVIEKRSKEEKFDNITTVHGSSEDPNFPRKNLDMIVMMLVYHELEKPIVYFQNVKEYLKPGANVVVIERDPRRLGQGEDHFMTRYEILDKIEESDYEVVNLESFLAFDDIYILRPKN